VPELRTGSRRSSCRKDYCLLRHIGSGMEPRITIVILNWNGWSDTLECLESLRRVSHPRCSVVVVDNASTDGSVDRINEYCEGRIVAQSRFSLENRARALIEVTQCYGNDESASCRNPRPIADSQWSKNLTLILNKENLGFAKGNNMALRYAITNLEQEYVLLLNNDTFVDPDFLTELIVVAEMDKSIGILSPKMYYYDFKGRSDVIWYAGGEIDPMREWVFFHLGQGEIDAHRNDRPTETKWCPGAAMLIRRSALEHSLLNPAYPFGTEDVEYCLEARRLGMKVVCVPTSKVWHKVGVSRERVGNRIRRDVAGYFYFIGNNFSRPIYLYHIVLFFAAVLPRWAFAYAAGDRDPRTSRNFIAEIRGLAVYFLRPRRR